MAEALRVASAGVALTFWNAASLPYMLHRVTNRKNPWHGPVFCWWQVWRALRSLAAGSYQSEHLKAKSPIATADIINKW